MTKDKDIKPLNIHQRLAAAQASVGHVEKKGYNEMQRYNYVTESDVIASAKKALGDAGLSLSVSFLNSRNSQVTYGQGKNTQMFETEGNFTLTNIDNITEQIVSVVPGMAFDSGDKACWKAMTGITKAFLSKTLLISTGEDPEADKETDNHAPPKQAFKYEAPPAKPAARPPAGQPQQRALTTWNGFEGAYFKYKLPYVIEGSKTKAQEAQAKVKSAGARFRGDKNKDGSFNGDTGADKAWYCNEWFEELRPFAEGVAQTLPPLQPVNVPVEPDGFDQDELPTWLTEEG